MAEYIERKGAYTLAKKIVDAVHSGEYSSIQLPHFILDAIDDIPAADVRPVVLCRDCKHWELTKFDPTFRVCTYVCGAIFVRKAEDFCSRGEKREES